MGFVRGGEAGGACGLHTVSGQREGGQGTQVDAAHGAPGAALPHGAAAEVPGAAPRGVPASPAVAAQP